MRENPRVMERGGVPSRKVGSGCGFVLQSLAVPSLLAEANQRPSREKLSAQISWRCPLRVRIRFQGERLALDGISQR